MGTGDYRKNAALTTEIALPTKKAAQLKIYKDLEETYWQRI